MARQKVGEREMTVSASGGRGGCGVAIESGWSSGRAVFADYGADVIMVEPPGGRRCERR